MHFFVEEPVTFTPENWKGSNVFLNFNQDQKVAIV